MPDLRLMRTGMTVEQRGRIETGMMVVLKCWIKFGGAGV
jgi:hypothetical protein